ncbi:hypothetical protein THAOC_17459 [Thalassiosira oceanica]|uniref:MYND-type domain-containing protein n=1 Tax=Thalassiosira oceanica TaxID=159749 RepID=K0SAG1_THAOC|nr:hypothetical protein THAOC_17459 [Thalassiosira oceanica]|eukprot:EJK61959.1 hypothetical protein THAOC_17459 [Thalassiosira oceanica]
MKGPTDQVTSPPVAASPLILRRAQASKGRKLRKPVASAPSRPNEVSDRFQLRHHDKRDLALYHLYPAWGASAERREAKKVPFGPTFRRRAACEKAAEATASDKKGLWLLIPIRPSGTSMMSCVPVADAVDETCANCGKQGGDTVKLKNCTACRLVKYCGVDCQSAHRKQHKKACKQRAAELKDEELYSQGHERSEGDFCPICALPIPLPKEDHSVFKACCMKKICNGCDLAVSRRGMFDCAFCRTPIPDNDADRLAMLQARVKKKDPEAINFLGEKYCHGGLGLQKDMQMAVELWTEAAELGSIEALYNLGVAYYNGDGVQQDRAIAVELYRKAAMKGHVDGRHNLGCCEGEKGNYDHAVKHWLISAKMGQERSVKMIKKLFMGGLATKKQYAEAMRGHQDAVEEMKSHDRDEAKAINF